LSFAQINPSSFAQTNSLVSLVFAGDTTLDDDAGDLIAKGGDPFAAFESFFAKADIRITNFPHINKNDVVGADPVFSDCTYRASWIYRILFKTFFFLIAILVL
jgi:poly-gamma-glutamate synthesis protein (capsule biosynthesis protein)